MGRWDTQAFLKGYRNEKKSQSEVGREVVLLQKRAKRNWKVKELKHKMMANLSYKLSLKRTQKSVKELVNKQWADGGKKTVPTHCETKG